MLRELFIPPAYDPVEYELTEENAACGESCIATTCPTTQDFADVDSQDMLEVRD